MNDNGCRDVLSRQLYTSVLLGERVVSKAAEWGSNPHARADLIADVARLRKASAL